MLSGLHICREYWDADNTDIDRLRERAKRVAWQGRLRDSGASRAAHLAHYAGRAALQRLFEKHGIAAWVSPEPEFGYLYVRDEKGPRTDLFANITHTNGIAVAVLAVRSVGIDVERLTRPTDRVLPRVSTAAEREQLAKAKLPTGLPPGVALWTAKEAISKATGLGIKFGMQEFTVDWQASTPRAVTLHREGPLPLERPAVDWLVDKDYAIAICTERSLWREPVIQL